MRWLVGVVSAIVVLGLLPGAGAGAQTRPHRGTLRAADPTALYVGEVNAELQIDDSPDNCGSHTHYSYTASGLHDAGGGGAALATGSSTHPTSESGSGSVVQDPCGESPGCTDTLTLTQAFGPGSVDFQPGGGSVAVYVHAGGWAESGSCGVPFQYVGFQIAGGSIPLSEIGSPTITVALTGFPPIGTKTSTASGTLTLHRVDTPLKGDELAAPHATLLETKVWRATLNNPRATAKSYTWQMKPSSASRWTTLDTTKDPTYKITYRLAGNFDRRVFFNGASAGGPPVDLVSPVRPVEVRFPTWNEIATNQAVRADTQEAWRITLRLATDRFRQEVGYWITLNACSATYDHTPLLKGPPVKNDRDGEIRLGRRPADDMKNPDPVKGCAIYPVASFHTHTPTTYRTVPTRRRIGPSPEDQQADIDDQVPGIVFDYLPHPPKGKTIPNGYPKHEPAIRWRSGLPVRPTPR